MNYDYDIVVVGGGPGGYVAAIRAAQLGKKVAIIEKESLGGVCLNWGCIPTKSLLKNAYVLDLVKNASKYGIDIPSFTVDWTKVVKRSRNIAKRLSKGIEYLMKKNKIDHFYGIAILKDSNSISIKSSDDSINMITSDYIVIATGTKQRNLPNLTIDHKQIISSKEAMVLDNIPKRMTIIGAGAIGVEFAHLYNAFGCNVTLVEAQENILPNEDLEISSELQTLFSKRKINIITNKLVDKVIKNKKTIKLHLGKDVIETDIVLVAVGVSGNIFDLGLEKLNIKTDGNFILTNKHMQSNVSNIYAIGDVSGPPLLAHVASAEGIEAVEHICGIKNKGIYYDNIPACTYCEPEIASVGLTEKVAKEKGYEIKVGKFPFRALGKSLADGSHEGFVKTIYDAKYGELLGCHIIGNNASNLISEIAIARTLETTYHEILKTIHPHPTLSEAIQESTGVALDEAIHI
ncbi:MAG: dihydrolipoyl dehydrogenase [Candidatus Marinimicrobia bacterium]|nr:dihydrolipoyl dehydrogenase [Candidatus Neomarinimicrobiota bacterium]|tara:strand:- start:10213 stop:11595 length:1383 start_codon:yes stop_codon:yes gene_type:complete